MKKLIFFTLICLGILMPAACGGSEPEADDGNAITGIDWQWQSVTNRTTNQTTTVPDPENYTIMFNEDGIFNGTANCNSFSGTYSTEDGFTLTLGPSTLAYCGEASLDTVYLDLLNNVVAGGPDGAGGFALETPGGEQRMLFSS